MNAAERKLAELVHERPNLYDQSRVDYKDAVKCLQSWGEVAGAMGRPEFEVRIKWKNLRDKFCKAKKRMARRSGPLVDEAENGAVERPAPALLHQLGWLSDFVKPREEAASDKRVSGRGDDLERTCDKVKEQHTPLSVISTSFSLAEACPTNGQELVCLNRKMQANTETEISSADALTKIRDEDELFLLSLLPSLKRLTIKKRMEVRMKFQEVLYTAEFED
ncbi:transcription factor Adf-1-like [Platichthys flesus]|uniref:transcription factor Adf-1-like n=1 Tax=Platichthys flesus TaxID=8260 RepID=UPI002DBB252C|nr:transcription factor Adf-1-like [Platichthys flesus]